MASVIEQCQVAPPPGSAAEFRLSLTYFDLQWLTFHSMRFVYFYKHQISKTSFIETIIPTLKASLSLTLKHHLPLAGNVLCPLNSSGYPELRYVTGDSVSVTFSETDADFNYLVGNHPRNAKDYYPFVPQLAEPADAPGVQIGPVLAIQVTLFPNLGISVGFTHDHIVGDGSSLVGFARAWALLNKFGDEQFLPNELIPFYDRSIVNDPHGQGISLWQELKSYKIEMCNIMTLPDKVRGTFIIGLQDIERLKNLILSRTPSQTHVTSFIVTCAYVWTCLINSEAAIGEEIDETRTEFFVCAADCRARFNPPIPPTYFGNCTVPYITRTTHASLVGKEGFRIAVELIREAIQKRKKDDEWIQSGDWYKEICTTDWTRALSIAGSPKFDYYATDYGWGIPEKLEYISIDNGDGISMSLFKDSNGDLEIGLSLPKVRMNAFSAIFTHGLNFL